MATTTDPVYAGVVEASEAAGMPREQLDWFFASASAPSVEEFLLGDGHIVEEAYPWETAANPLAALQARKKELLSKGVSGNVDHLREWITLIHMEEAHDTVADVGDGVLSEDELYRRFLEEELEQQGSRPPVSIADFCARPRGPPERWTAADLRGAGCMVREVQLALPAGSTLGMGLQKPSIGQVGVWVNRIAPGGAASRIRPEVRVGDVVVEIDGRAVLGARLVDVSERLKPKGRLVRVAFVHRTELDSAVAAVDPLGSANAGRFAEDDIGRVTGTARGNGNAADEYAPQRDDGVGNGDSRRRSASHSDGATDVGKDDENGSRHLGRNRSSSDGWETQNFDGGWKQRGGRQNHGSGSFSAAFLATDSDGTDGIGVDPSDGVALDASAGGARDTGGARERWEEPVGGGRYDDEDEWRGVGQHMMSPVRAEETSTYESLSFRSGAARARLRDAAKGAAEPPTSPVRDVYEDRDPNRAPREVDRLNPSEDFKLTVKSELKPVAAYVEPAGSVAEANAPYRAMRDVERIEFKEDFVTYAKGKGIVPLPTLPHEPYVDPGKVLNRGVPKPRQNPRTGSTASARSASSPSSSRPSSRIPLSKHARSTGSPAVGRKGKERSKDGSSNVTFDLAYHKGLVSQCADLTQRYESTWAEYESAKRQHVVMLRECRAAGRDPGHAATAPTAHRDERFSDPPPQPLARGVSNADVRSACKALRDELRSRQDSLSELDAVVAGVMSARDAVMLTSLGVTPRRLTLRRSGARSTFGIQLETDRTRPLLATRVHAVSNSSVMGHAQARDADMPLPGDCVVSVEGSSTLIWTHAEVLAAFAKCAEKVTIEFVSSVAADAILGACARAVAADDARASGGGDGGGGGGGGGNMDGKRNGESVDKAHAIDISVTRETSSATTLPYAWQTGADFREKMELRSAELDRMNVASSSAALREEWRALKEARVAMGML